MLKRTCSFLLASLASIYDEATANLSGPFMAPRQLTAYFSKYVQNRRYHISLSPPFVAIVTERGNS